MLLLSAACYKFRINQTKRLKRAITTKTINRKPPKRTKRNEINETSETHYHIRELTVNRLIWSLFRLKLLNLSALQAIWRENRRVGSQSSCTSVSHIHMLMDWRLVEWSTFTAFLFPKVSWYQESKGNYLLQRKQLGYKDIAHLSELNYIVLFWVVSFF